MVDKVTANPGSGGPDFAGDDDGTAFWPFAKVAFGELNVDYNIVDAANPLPVTDAAAETSLSLIAASGASAANQATGNTSLGLVVTNTGGLVLAQASTTAGQLGPLLQGATTTAAPTYVTAKTNPLSLDTSGNLRINLPPTTLADGTANPTIGSVGGFNMVWNGTSWDRMRTAGYNIAPTSITSGIQYVSAQIWGGNLSGGATAKSPTVDIVNEGIPIGQILGLFNASIPLLYDGVSVVNRQRGNTDATFLASAARTATQTSADLLNYNAKGINVILDMTVAGSGSVTLTINAKDPTSGKYYPILAGAAVVSNSTNVYSIYPGGSVTSNVSANAALPRTFQIVVTANNANSMTYSVGYSLIL